MLPERLMDVEGKPYVRCYLHGLIPADHRCDQSPSHHFCGTAAHPNHVEGEDHDDQGTSHNDWAQAQSEKLSIIAHLHAKVEGPGGTTDGTCCECNYLWPCRTYHLAAGWGLGDECYDEGWCAHAGMKCDKDEDYAGVMGNFDG